MDIFEGIYDVLCMMEIVFGEEKQQESKYENIF